MSAIHAVLQLFQAGDQIIVSRNVYGGTYRLFEGLLRQFGLEFSWVDSSDLQELEGAIRKNTKMIFVETPTNPTLTLTDLSKVAKIAAAHRLTLTVDNTFMSPALQNPIALGADIVVHSTTKYINGHSDSVGGCVITTKKKHADRIAWIQNTVGAILSPMDSFMVLRGIKTLSLRMERHCKSAGKIAAWLEAHRKVKQVIYPGLKSHPQHRLARKQMRGFGGMISFDMGSMAQAKRLLGRVKLCAMAESLGGVETLISHPASMTHFAVPKEDREKIGVTGGSGGGSDPGQVVFEPGLHRQLENLRAVIRVEFQDRFFNLRVQRRRRFDQQHPLLFGLHLPVPAEHRADRSQDVHAGGQAAFHEGAGDGVGLGAGSGGGQHHRIVFSVGPGLPSGHGLSFPETM